MFGLFANIGAKLGAKKAGQKLSQKLSQKATQKVKQKAFDKWQENLRQRQLDWMKRRFTSQRFGRVLSQMLMHPTTRTLTKKTRRPSVSEKLRENRVSDLPDYFNLF